MTKSIAFIDCFVNTPVNHCVNDFVTNSNILSTYHMPSQYGMYSLESLNKADAYIVLGSASHVSENLPWHKELLDFLIPKLESGIPILGICFGHQLLAKHYGCEVGYLNANEENLVHTRAINITSNQIGLISGETFQLAFSHSQVVLQLSNQMKSFATSSLSNNEAIYHTKYPLWSFQAHPEASEKFIQEEIKITDEQQIQCINQDGINILNSFIQYIS